MSPLLNTSTIKVLRRPVEFALGAAISVIGFNLQAANERELAARKDLVGVAQQFDLDASRAFASYLECETRADRYLAERSRFTVTQAEVALYARASVFDATLPMAAQMPSVDLYRIYQGDEDRPLVDSEVFDLARVDFLRAVCDAVNPYRDGACADLAPPPHPSATPSPLPSEDG